MYISKLVSLPLYLLEAWKHILHHHLLWRLGWVFPRGKTPQNVHTSLFTGPPTVINSQAHPHWTHCHLSLIVQLFPGWHWFPGKFHFGAFCPSKPWYLSSVVEAAICSVISLQNEERLLVFQFVDLFYLLGVWQDDPCAPSIWNTELKSRVASHSSQPRSG